MYVSGFTSVCHFVLLFISFNNFHCIYDQIETQLTIKYPKNKSILCTTMFLEFVWHNQWKCIQTLLLIGTCNPSTTGWKKKAMFLFVFGVYLFCQTIYHYRYLYRGSVTENVQFTRLWVIYRLGLRVWRLAKSQENTAQFVHFYFVGSFRWQAANNENKHKATLQKKYPITAFGKTWWRIMWIYRCSLATDTQTHMHHAIYAAIRCNTLIIIAYGLLFNPSTHIHPTFHVKSSNSQFFSTFFHFSFHSCQQCIQSISLHSASMHVLHSNV